MQLIPATFYFPPDKEKDFQYQLNKSTVHFANIALYLAALFLTILVILSWLNDEQSISSVINILRLSMVCLSFVLVYVNNKLKAKYLHYRCFAYGILFCVLFGYLFWSFVGLYGYLNEGGPMLVVASFSAIPMLHLGHKLILWTITGLSLLSVHLFSSTPIIWSLYFYISIVIVMACIQYQLDILLRKQYEAELSETQKANIDQLTGLHNRHSFDSECKRLMSQIKPSQSLALAMVDIDDFKKYNDNYGHLDGDNILIDVASRLKKLQADIVVRFGGEEFILVKILDQNNVNWLDDLPNRFATDTISHEYSTFKRVTVSAGVVVADFSALCPEMKALLSVADKAMYKAKNTGKNKVIKDYI
ncbi:MULTISPECIES: GGDEF domain-containing protein [Pseudoalteromonas]|uniref:GGDEF domain-containing protein n=1 Tax=Pseudoalteromonas TaxID=53246 RepID=UPI000579E33D|nr:MULTISPECIES: GGDEF domain-containing protein [Pseudoalteromonas]ATG58087.1 GGDEF domain-containing protein [Pseudoalteromonas marina]